AAKLRNTLVRHGAELVIHGHDQVPSRMFLKGGYRPIPVIGVASASEARSAFSCPGYNLYRIEAKSRPYTCEMLARALSSDEQSMADIERVRLALSASSMSPKSGNRFSEKIMLQQICRAGKSFEESYPALWARTKQQGRCNQRCQPGERPEHDRPCGTPAPASPVRAGFVAEIAQDRQGAVRKGAFA